MESHEGLIANSLDLSKEVQTRNETKAPTPDGWRVRSDRLK